MSQRFNQGNRSGPPRPPQESPAAVVPNDFIRGDMSKIVDEARQIGIRLKDSQVDMNQLRNFYEAVVQLGIRLQEKQRVQHSKKNGQDVLVDTSVEDQVRLLPTKLIWAAAKQDNDRKANALKEFHAYVQVAVNNLFEQDKLQYGYCDRFQQFVEAVVVYHKGRDKRII